MYCGCGCGEVTPVAPRNLPDRGWRKGEHVPFVRGHRAGVQVGYAVEDRGWRTPCFIWRGVKIGRGYGRVTRGGAKTLAHVAAYEAKYGPVPAGLTLDHLCRQPSCVNPDHLEPVTHAENCRRGGATKLTADQARAIKYGGGLARNVSESFGVSRSTVQAIRNGRLWQDI